MLFIESPSFPEAIGLHTTVGLSFQTDIVQLGSGGEQRNACWSQPLRRYDLSSAALPLEELLTLQAFFQAVQGRFLGFRFRDILEYSSSAGSVPITAHDQVLGQGDGVTSRFPLIKTSVVGEQRGVRRIQKPVVATVVVAVDGIPLDAACFTVDCSRGEITFLPEFLPPAGSVISAGFHFDVPCRFANDDLLITLHSADLGSIALSLVELRLPEYSS